MIWKFKRCTYICLTYAPYTVKLSYGQQRKNKIILWQYTNSL